MKKIILILCCTCSIIAIAQDNYIATRSEEIKSGNHKDVLHNFYQFALKNFSTKENAIEFNSTLFAIKSSCDEELLLDTNFVRETFSRNFQINLKLDLDGNYDYRGFSGGVTYAVWNARDKQIVNLVNTQYGTLYDKYRTILTTQVKPAIESEFQDLSLGDKNVQTELLEAAMEAIANNITLTNNIYYQKIIDEFKRIADLPNLISYSSYLQELYDLEIKEIEAQPLLTISSEGSLSKEGKFDKASLGAVFLKGFGKNRWEIDARTNINYADTITSENLARTAFNTKIGVNYKAYKTKEKSFFEIKAYGEYNSILKNVLPDEKKDTFLANAEFRIRLNDDLWLPITVKYDIENSNVLGFLNITYNFEPLNKK